MPSEPKDGTPARGRGRGRPRGSKASRMTSEADRNSSASGLSEDAKAGGNSLVQESNRGGARGRGARVRGGGVRGGKSGADKGRKGPEGDDTPMENDVAEVPDEKAIRSAVESRKSTKELSGIQARRTSAQVEQDKATASAEAKARAAEKEKAALDLRIAVAGIEDDLHMEEENLLKSSVRPDLVPIVRTVSKPKV